MSGTDEPRFQNRDHIDTRRSDAAAPRRYPDAARRNRDHTDTRRMI